MTTDRAQDEGGRLTPQNLMQSGGRERGVVIGHENSEYDGRQGHLVIDEIGLLAAMGADHVPQAVHAPDRTGVRADPINFFRSAIGVPGTAFGAQMSVEIHSQILASLLPPVKIYVKFSIQSWFYVSSHRTLTLSPSNYSASAGS
jgi:hypothetical protein